MKLRIKNGLIAIVLYALPIYDNNTLIPEHKTLLDELSCGRTVTDHLHGQYSDGDVIVIFYDDDSNPTPQVIKAFWGHWKRNGYTFDIKQHFGYKFTPFSEVTVFPVSMKIYEYFTQSAEIFYEFKNTEKL